MKLKHFAATAFIALALVASPASFASIVGASNLNNNFTLEAFLGSTLWRGQSFTVASGQDYILSDVQIITRVSDPTYFLRIYADNASIPGTLLEELSFSLATPTTVFAPNGTAVSGVLRTFSSTGLSLTASSTYWVVAGLTSGFGGSWFGTNSTTETGLPGWTIGNSVRTSTTAGASWLAPFSSALYTNINVNPQNVPEPSILGLIGIAGISLLRRRKTA